jgi:CheY-like chemotaxis protein
MLVKCPSCGAKIRVSTGRFNLKEKLTRYLCQECEQIVMIDLVADVIPTSSSSDAAIPESIPHAARILIADDTESFVRVAEDLLRREGYVVIVAHDGTEALKKISEERPDAILLDLFMPNMTGFEVLKTLKTSAGYKNFRNIPVLVTSGVYKPAEVELIHDLGASGFISKEAVPEFLIYRIKKILSAPAPEDQLKG